MSAQSTSGEKPARRKPSYKKLKPDALRSLQSRVGTAQCMELLGVAGSTITDAIAKDEVSMTTELAARHCLSKLDKEAAAPILLVVEVPRDKTAVVEQLLHAMGARFTRLFLGEKK